MQNPEELLQIGGPIILEELPKDRDTDESEELPELFVSECLELISVKTLPVNVFAVELISLCSTVVDATCCLKAPSRTKTPTQPPDGG